MEYILQIMLGTFMQKPPDTEKVLRTLEQTYDRIGPQDIIVGWTTENESYKQLLDFVHSNGKKVWLWLPVFSELPGDLSPDPTYNYLGNLQKGLEVLPNEDFRFVCPSSLHNQMLSLRLFDRHFSSLSLDGVFLDKIRHASFAGGLEHAFGCFCPNCQKRYAEVGVNMGQIRHLLEEHPEAFFPSALDGLRYRFDHPEVDRFYRAKADIITDAAEKIAAGFRDRGLMVAFDVFAPVVAYFMGQDIEKLSKEASFMKPMMYRITHAPAGLPFELEHLDQAFASSGYKAASLLQRIWDKESMCSADAADEQIARMQGSCAASVYPGYEINGIPGICDNTPDYAAECAKRYSKLGVEKSVLSWNLLADTDRNISGLKRTGQYNA